MRLKLTVCMVIRRIDRMLMLVSLMMLTRIDVRLFRKQAEQQAGLFERAALVD